MHLEEVLDSGKAPEKAGQNKTVNPENETDSSNRPNPESPAYHETISDFLENEDGGIISKLKIGFFPTSDESKSMTSSYASGIINYPAELYPLKTHCEHGNLLHPKTNWPGCNSDHELP